MRSLCRPARVAWERSGRQGWTLERWRQLPARKESTMTVNSNGPLRDGDMETVGTAGQATAAQDADGLDSADADGTDTTDADGTDTTDADGTDTTDADGTDTTDADGTDTTDAAGTDPTDAAGTDPT